ncbi:ankyrin repeat-containing domain protein, partial [Mycena galopus ATCC 62051]
LLVENGCDLNLPGGYYGTALHAAWVGGQTITLRYLLKMGRMSMRLDFGGANVNMEGGQHGTPLGCTAFNGLQEICRILIEHGADVNFRWTDEGGMPCNALWLAASEGHTTCVNLLAENGAD